MYYTYRISSVIDPLKSNVDKPFIMLQLT